MPTCRPPGAKHLAGHPAVVDEAVAAVGPEHLATLIYTSGTTGRPKGVELPHRCWTYVGARAELVGQLRRTASAGMRPPRTSPPVREILQNAGFLEDYLLARHQLQFDSRAFAPLRRDERNAWDRASGAREAYIAPALKPDGATNPRWITRSDWNTGRRIVATPRTERLFDLYKVYVLAGRPGSAEASYLGPRRPVDALLEKYAHDTLATKPPPASAPDDESRAWRAEIRDRVGTIIGEIRREDEPDRKRIARKLAGLSDRERIWGQSARAKSQRRQT